MFSMGVGLCLGDVMSLNSGGMTAPGVNGNVVICVSEGYGERKDSDDLVIL